MSDEDFRAPEARDLGERPMNPTTLRESPIDREDRHDRLEALGYALVWTSDLGAAYSVRGGSDAEFPAYRFPLGAVLELWERPPPAMAPPVYVVAYPNRVHYLQAFSSMYLAVERSI